MNKFELYLYSKRELYIHENTKYLKLDKNKKLDEKIYSLYEIYHLYNFRSDDIYQVETSDLNQLIELYNKYGDLHNIFISPFRDDMGIYGLTPKTSPYTDFINQILKKVTSYFPDYNKIISFTEKHISSYL